jgi:hypothetical protein
MDSHRASLSIYFFDPTTKLLQASMDRKLELQIFRHLWNRIRVRSNPRRWKYHVEQWVVSQRIMHHDKNKNIKLQFAFFDISIKHFLNSLATQTWRTSTFRQGLKFSTTVLLLDKDKEIPDLKNRCYCYQQSSSQCPKSIVKVISVQHSWVILWNDDTVLSTIACRIIA